MVSWRRRTRGRAGLTVGLERRAGVVCSHARCPVRFPGLFQSLEKLAPLLPFGHPELLPEIGSRPSLDSSRPRSLPPGVGFFAPAAMTEQVSIL